METKTVVLEPALSALEAGLGLFEAGPGVLDVGPDVMERIKIERNPRRGLTANKTFCFGGDRILMTVAFLGRTEMPLGRTELFSGHTDLPLGTQNAV